MIIGMSPVEALTVGFAMCLALMTAAWLVAERLKGTRDGHQD